MYLPGMGCKAELEAEQSRLWGEVLELKCRDTRLCGVMYLSAPPGVGRRVLEGLCPG